MYPDLTWDAINNIAMILGASALPGAGSTHVYYKATKVGLAHDTSTPELSTVAVTVYLGVIIVEAHSTCGTVD